MRKETILPSYTLDGGIELYGVYLEEKDKYILGIQTPLSQSLDPKTGLVALRITANCYLAKVLGFDTYGDIDRHWAHYCHSGIFTVGKTKTHQVWQAVIDDKRIRGAKYKFDQWVKNNELAELTDVVSEGEMV